MEKINDYKCWAQSLNIKLKNKESLSNLYLMPEQLQSISREQRLCGEELISGGFILLVDEGEYDSLYFKIKSVEDFKFQKQQKPVLVEIVYMDNKEEEIQIMKEMLIENGFYMRVCCVQFSGSLREVENARFEKEMIYKDYRISPGTREDKDVVLRYWERMLSPYDFRDRCKAEILTNLENQKIICARDKNNNVCGASFLALDGRNISNRHVVVDTDHQGKGLGKALLSYGEMYGAESGCKSMTGWVALDNEASLTVHRKIMKETNRKLVQFVLE